MAGGGVIRLQVWQDPSKQMLASLMRHCSLLTPFSGRTLDKLWVSSISRKHVHLNFPWFRRSTKAGAHHLWLASLERETHPKPISTTWRKWRNRWSPKNPNNRAGDSEEPREQASVLFSSGRLPHLDGSLPWHPLLSWSRHLQSSGLPQHPLSPHLPFNTKDRACLPGLKPIPPARETAPDQPSALVQLQGTSS